MLRNLAKRACSLQLTHTRSLSDRTHIAYESNFDAPSLRLALHFHISGHDDVALERFLKHTSTFCKQAGYQVDGRVALPTTVQKLEIRKPPNKYSRRLEETIYLKTHRRIIRVSDVPGTEVDIVLDTVTRTIPPGAKMTLHDEKTEPLSDELLRLLKGGAKLPNVDEYTGVNPVLHRWININFETRIKDPVD